MKISAYPKINLCLDILKKTPSGYHEIRTVFHEIKNFKDIIEINKTKSADKVSIKYSLKKMSIQGIKPSKKKKKRHASQRKNYKTSRDKKSQNKNHREILKSSKENSPSIRKPQSLEMRQE
ncbi:hypothetical protein HZC20_03415 [Candidatus Peregrinibacteria bacterium]|nr:hypothetical protein [Candidatus Peregrinibacteria bacterium]